MVGPSVQNSIRRLHASYGQERKTERRRLELLQKLAAACSRQLEPSFQIAIDRSRQWKTLPYSTLLYIKHARMSISCM